MRLLHCFAFGIYLNWFLHVCGNQAKYFQNMQNAKNAYVNRMWQLGFKKEVSFLNKIYGLLKKHLKKLKIALI
jgi:hypothetical protein